MYKFLKVLGVSALSVLAILSACSDDPEPCKNGAFELTINGEATTGTSFDNTLGKAAGASVAIKRMDIRATDAEGRQLVITLSDYTSGINGDGISTDPYIPYGDVTSGTENNFYFTLVIDGVSYPVTDGLLDVTSCDANAKQVSGTFSFSDGDFEVTNGSFTNMCYTVL